MMTGRVTDYAKKKFQEGNADVDEYLKDVKNQMTDNLLGKNTKSTTKIDKSAKA